MHFNISQDWTLQALRSKLFLLSKCFQSIIFKKLAKKISNCNFFHFYLRICWGHKHIFVETFKVLLFLLLVHSWGTLHEATIEILPTLSKYSILLAFWQPLHFYELSCSHSGWVKYQRIWWVGGEGDVSHKNVRWIVKLKWHREAMLNTEPEHFSRTFFWFWPLMWHIVIPQVSGQKWKKNPWQVS